MLLLADEPKSARALQFLLSDWGYGVVAAATADGLRATPCDHGAAVAIVLDLVHAQVSAALSAALAVRGQLAWHVPILLCAEHGAVAPDAEAATTVFAKPVNPERVRNWLGSLVDARRHG